MRASPISPSLTAVPPFPATTRFLLHPPPSYKATASLFLSIPCPRFLFSKFKPCPFCSNSDATTNEEDDAYFDVDDDGIVSSDDETQPLSEDGVFIEIKKLGGNSRRIRSKIGIEANLDTVWNILTNYEKLADVIPGLAVSEVVEKKHKFARLYQIGQQSLPLGLKFNAKGVIDCYEKDLEILPSGKKREIQFKMVEGDFTMFEGTWLIEQVAQLSLVFLLSQMHFTYTFTFAIFVVPFYVDAGGLFRVLSGVCPELFFPTFCSSGLHLSSCMFNKRKYEGEEASLGEEFQTTLWYLVDLKPKIWLPVRLVENRLSIEIKTNLLSIREEAERVISALNSA
ncbi:Polyketide_cyc domain-containing protein [Gossypium australe]|uniref:Polyketide_cyc domain-containing protein n=1 Tax=Gossypium australe TaxID=47621 RepID=A0A5B6UPD2_9ROSI|nr:Polyketide_cyc domain-containing protein [Gossypium australe]